MQMYVLVPEDRCAKQVGLQCGYPESDHPLNVSGYYHEFEPGRMKFVPASPSQIKEAYYGTL
jgi:hypothetical protein